MTRENFGYPVGIVLAMFTAVGTIMALAQKLLS
ncbi:Loki-CTERM sorting domain-containing protein [Pseudomonas antarctica]